ncbi:MAG: hypothetical protein H8E35_08835 [Ardenticatenia bacterium]|nr:hypothetical protein [Ardenticatenia bacterium]
MTGKAYRVVLRLRSPLHVGRMKLGNVQRTHPYVTGRVLWGALTERLTRDGFRGGGPATDSQLYQEMGKRVHNELAFTYLFPTIHADGKVDLWPWEDDFQSRFLSTYASTALTYPQQSAEEGSLHEVECIAPHTLDTGDPVYLTGYVFKGDGVPDWQAALQRLQIGGERGYGWGWVQPVEDPVLWDGQSLFDWYAVERDDWPPVLTAGKDARLLAHALAADFDEIHKAVSGVKGPIEPLVGRETDPEDGRFGVWISQARVCYVPGSQVKSDTTFRVGPYGIWEAV